MLNQPISFRCVALALVLALGTASGCQTGGRRTGIDPGESGQSKRIATAGCAMCIFGMDVNDCVLGVKIDGVAYLVTGKDINDLGDAHASDGLCMTGREAIVVGKVKDNRFVATSFELK